MDSEFWQDAEHRVERARDLLRRRRLPEAFDELQAAAELDPYNPVHHFELARCLELLNRPEEAVDAYGRAAEIDPAEPAYLNALGAVLLRLSRWREAVAVFAQVEKLDPEFEPAYANRIIAYAELGDHDRAEQMFYLAQQVKENSPEAFYNVGRSLAMRGEHVRAIWCWRKVLELLGGMQHPASPASPPAGGQPGWLVMHSYLRIAESLSATGDMEQARRHYLHALARNGRQLEALLGLGELLLQMRQFDAAAERINRAVRLDPDDPRGHMLAGRRYLAVGKYDEAGVALRRAAELDPTMPRVHLMLARVAMREEDALEVKRHCRAEMLLRPEDGATLHELGGMLLDVGDLDNAVACLKRLVAVDPNNTRAWQNLGVAECWRGHLMQGVVASRRALKLDPGNLQASNNLAVAFLEMRELDAAAKVIRDGLSHAPRNRQLRRLAVRLRVLRALQTARKTALRLLGRDEE